MNYSAKTNFKARNLILDYALGAAIVALLPIPNIGGWQAIALVLLNILLVIGIARLWQFQKGGDLLARIGIMFGIAGTILMGFLVWLLMVAVGVVVPLIGALAPGMATFCYFWGMGQAVNHFYVNQLLLGTCGKITYPWIGFRLRSTLNHLRAERSRSPVTGTLLICKPLNSRPFFFR